MHFLQAGSLLAATITTGLVAGLMAAFAYAVMPGLARAGDQVFVAAMQRINVAIVNPWFVLCFLGAPVFGLLAVVVHMRSGQWPVFWWALAGLALYLVGLVITGTVNVPLNKQLDGAADLDDRTELAAARNRFEGKWRRWNTARAVACAASLACFAWALVEHGRLG